MGWNIRYNSKTGKTSPGGSSSSSSGGGSSSSSSGGGTSNLKILTDKSVQVYEGSKKTGAKLIYTNTPGRSTGGTSYNITTQSGKEIPVTVEEKSSFKNVAVERQRELEKNKVLSTTQQNELYKSLEEQKQNNSATIQKQNNRIQQVGVAVSGEDLKRFRQSFQEAGYNTAGELLRGIRKGEVKKEGETYTITKPLISKEEKEAKPTLTEKGRTILYEGVRDIKTFFKDYEEPNPITEGKTKRINTQPLAEPLKIFTGMGKVTYGFTKISYGFALMFVGETYKQMITQNYESTKNFEILDLVKGIKENNMGLIKQSLSEAEGGIALGMLFSPLTLVKPTGLNNLGWYEADAIKTATDFNYNFQKPGFDLRGNRIRGFQPVDELRGLSKSPEIQSQLYPKKVEPLDLITRPENPLKAELTKRGLQREGLIPNPEGEGISLTFEELTGEARLKNLKEIAKKEVTKKETFYQREIIEYSKPSDLTKGKPGFVSDNIKIDLITEAKPKIRILANKKGELKTSFQSKVYEKGSQFEFFPEKKTFITSTEGGIITKTPINFARVVLPLTSGLITGKDLSDTESILNIKSKNKLDSQIRYKPMTKIDTSSKLIFETPQDIGIKQIIKPIQITGQSQDIGVIQITEQDSFTGINISSLKSPDIIKPPETPKDPNPPIPSLRIPSFQSSNFKGGVFTVQVKRRGMFRDLDSSTDVESIFKKGRDVTKRTAGASFRIINPSGQVLNPDKLSNSFLSSGMFTRSKSNRNVVVEKNRFRIDTPGEKAEITFKGILSNSFNNKTKKKKKGVLNFF